MTFDSIPNPIEKDELMRAFGRKLLFFPFASQKMFYPEGLEGHEGKMLRILLRTKQEVL